MKNNELIYALNLTPENALEYFQEKGYAFSWKWDDLWQQEHSHAFTVAKMMQLDLLQDTRNIVNSFIKGDVNYKLAMLNLENRLRAKGWWGMQEIENPNTGEIENVQLGSPWRLRTILETNLITSISAGKYKTQLDNADFAPWWQYSDQEDERVRKKHRALGLLFKNAVLHYTHPFWQTYYPPNDWGCRCFVNTFTDDDVRSQKLIILKDIPQIFLDKNKPGKGWAYNPGMEKWKPDLSKYDPDLVNLIFPQK